MIRVKDLKLEKDVLRFFNYTNNDSAEASLIRLLKEVPATEEGVLERQAIIKGFIQNWGVLENFTYRKIAMSEVYKLFDTDVRQLLDTTTSPLINTIRLKLSGSERNRLKAKLIQLIQLLHSLQQQYLLQLDNSKFPDSFTAQLQKANQFLQKLQLDAQVKYITQNNFSVSRIIKFATSLNALQPSEIRAFWEFFFLFEAYWSVAKGTQAHSYVFPEFNDKEVFRIEDFYHPLITDAVKNTLELGTGKNVLMLTGPNMSGKSTLLKSVSLCVYLGRAGFPVPAAYCNTPFFSSVAVAINLNDNLQNGYSHFMAEIKNLKEILATTTGNKKCFAVFDEIFRGTNIDDALDITETTVKGLTKISGSYFLISTHLLELDEKISRTNNNYKKYHVDCFLNKGVPTFSYKLKEGWSQLKIGKIMFELEGLADLLVNKREERVIAD